MRSPTSNLPIGTMGSSSMETRYEADDVEDFVRQQGGVVMSAKTAQRVRDAGEDGMPTASLLGRLRKSVIKFLYLR